MLAHQTSCPCVVATVRRTPARVLSLWAIRPKGAAAPNHTDSQPISRAMPIERRVIAGVGSMIFDGSRTTGKGRVASNAASPG